MSESLIKTPGVFGDNGNFLLEREIGSGGMGGVYMGRDKMLDRPVAVKVMLKELGADEFTVELVAGVRRNGPGLRRCADLDGREAVVARLTPDGSRDGCLPVHRARTRPGPL